MAECKLRSAGVPCSQGVDYLLMEGFGSGLLSSPFRRLRKSDLGLAQRKTKLFTNGLDRESWEGATSLQLREPQRHFGTRFDHC